MRSFFKYVLATITGVFILLFLVIALLVASVASLSKKEPAKIAENSVLHLQFNYMIPEAPLDETSMLFASLGGQGAPVGMLDILRQIDRAVEDENISGVLLDLSFVGAGYARSSEIRNALLRFKASGKFIYAYSDNYYPQTYYLASVADSVFMQPEGLFLFNGISANVTFLKDMFEKIGVEMQVIKHGKFKGATEQFERNSLSEENRYQIKEYINSIHDHIISEMAASRRLNVDLLKQISNNMEIHSAEDAVKTGLLDGLMYRDELESMMRKKLKLKEDKKLPLVSLTKYLKSSEKKEGVKDQIAIIYANGEIVSGKGDQETIGDQTIREALIKIQKNDRIKAVVLRINSPGGSAQASDVIHREIEKTRALKPVIVSMGDVAASGGYYIAAAADTILCSPNTITGSIGVFGVVPNAQKLLNEKLGIRMEQVGTGEHSDFGRIDRPLSDFEQEYFRVMIDNIYDRFVAVVSTGRNMDKAAVDSLAQGRVYTGSMAMQNGLSDISGDFQEAIKIAAQKSGLKEFRISTYPKQKSPMEELLSAVTGEADMNTKLKELFGVHYLWVDQIMQAKRMEGVQLRLPYRLEIK